MRKMFLAAALVLGSVSAGAIDGPPPAMPGWIAGAWESRDGENWADEFWTPPRGGVMIGAGRSGKGQVAEFWEHTRIMRKTDGSLSFFAQPKGVPATEFPLFAQGPQSVEFLNAEHDYPQRIRYWREGKLLKARISLLDGSQAVEWTFAPMGGG